MEDVKHQIETNLGNQARRAEGNRLSNLLMSKFPCTLGRIDWRGARFVSEKAAPVERAQGANRPDGGFQASAYVGEVALFLNDQLSRNGRHDEWVAFVGDSIPHEYEVRREAVPALLRAVSEVPDHKYVFASTDLGASCGASRTTSISGSAREPRRRPRWTGAHKDVGVRRLPS